MELNEKIAALESENAALRAKLSKSEGARQAAQIYLDDAKEHCRNEVQKLRHKLSWYINKVAEIEKDKERLDWIEGNQGKIGIGDHVPITTIGDTAWMATFRDDLTVVVKTSYRECVDAAITREKESE